MWLNSTDWNEFIHFPSLHNSVVYEVTLILSDPSRLLPFLACNRLPVLPAHLKWNKESAFESLWSSKAVWIFTTWVLINLALESPLTFSVERSINFWVNFWMTPHCQESINFSRFSGFIKVYFNYYWGRNNNLLYRVTIVNSLTTPLLLARTFITLSI